MMPPDDPPQGQRFSHLYIERGEPTQDSQRMRRRLATLVSETEDLKSEMGTIVPRELGIAVPWTGWGVDWTNFFGTCSLRDALDFVTLAYQHLLNKQRTRGYGSGPGPWIREVRRIFAEENVHYTVDDQG